MAHHKVTFKSDNLTGLVILVEDELITLSVAQECLKVTNQSTHDKGLHPCVGGVCRKYTILRHEVPALVAKDQDHVEQS